MSDDGSYDPYVDDYEESSMEIVVETLTGTTFEMTVAPDDTIISIKSKIQRVEGIPVSQQHLLYRLKELTNEERLCDHGITAGSTLRLVLSMRGGPISTRRLTSSEHSLAWKELREYVDNSREDMIDKLPPGSKVTVLLFREGDNINLIRVIENEDGTCYPYSDSWAPPRLAPRENSQSKYHERSNENNIMMNKVIELRKKMEGLSMKKQAKKPMGGVTGVCAGATTKTIHDDVNEASTSSASWSRLRNSCLSFLDDDDDDGDDVDVDDEEDDDACVKFFGDSDLAMGNVSDVYSDRFLLVDHQRRTNRANGRLEPKPEDMPLPGRNCTSIQTPSIAILEEEAEASMNKKESEYSPPSPISVASGDANTVTMSQIPSLPGSSRNLLHLAHMPHMMLQEHTDRPKTSPDKFDAKAQEFCNVVFNDGGGGGGGSERTTHNSVKLSVNRRQSLDYSNKTTNLPRMQFASNSNSRIDNLDSNHHHHHSNHHTHHHHHHHHHHRTHARTQNNEWSTAATATTGTATATSTRTNSNLLTSQYASTSKLNSAHLDSVLGNRIESTTSHLKFNERRSPLYGRRARIERIRNNIMENANLNPEKYGYSNLGYIANIEKIQNDAVPITKQPTHQYNNIHINSNSNNSGSNSYCNINGGSSSSSNRRNLNFVSNLEPRNSCDPTSYELRPFKLPRRRYTNNNNNIIMDQDNNSTSKKLHEATTSCSNNSNDTNKPNNTINNNNNNNNKNSSSSNSNSNKSYNTSVNVSASASTSNAAQSLPPIVQKKTNRTRCAFCNKRLNITTIHTCRCGGIFCSQHRYSEVHGCHYDYKTEGRKILEQANPLVAAPKLPKI